MAFTHIDSDVREALTAASAKHSFQEQIEGPYHRPVHPDRRDIVEDRVGAPLRLGLRLLQADGRPSVGLAVEVWQADRDGRYSGFLPIQAKPGDIVTSENVPRQIVAPDETFLRGLQHTNDEGMCQFDTIYPGWYPSRTVHIHLIAHRSADRHLTSQLYFPEEVTDAVFDREPYAGRTTRDTRNADDSIFVDGGSTSVLTISETSRGLIGALSLQLPN